MAALTSFPRSPPFCDESIQIRYIQITFLVLGSPFPGLLGFVEDLTRVLPVSLMSNPFSKILVSHCSGHTKEQNFKLRLKSSLSTILFSNLFLSLFHSNQSISLSFSSQLHFGLLNRDLLSMRMLFDVLSLLFKDLLLPGNFFSAFSTLSAHSISFLSKLSLEPLVHGSFFC